LLLTHVNGTIDDNPGRSNRERRGAILATPASVPQDVDKAKRLETLNTVKAAVISVREAGTIRGTFDLRVKPLTGLRRLL
jgi:hypothetical protein